MFSKYKLFQLTWPLAIKVVVELSCVFTFGAVGKCFKVLNIAQREKGEGKLISGNLQPAERAWRLFTILPQPPNITQTCTLTHTHTKIQHCFVINLNTVDNATQPLYFSVKISCGAQRQCKTQLTHIPTIYCITAKMRQTVSPLLFSFHSLFLSVSASH